MNNFQVTLRKKLETFTCDSDNVFPFIGPCKVQTLKTQDTYRFVVRSATNGAILTFLDHRPLAGSGTIDSAALFAFETTGDQNFNRMRVVSPSLLAPIVFNVQPTNGSQFVNPGITNVSFAVDSPGSTITATNVSLLQSTPARREDSFGCMTGCFSREQFSSKIT